MQSFHCHSQEKPAIRIGSHTAQACYIEPCELLLGERFNMIHPALMWYCFRRESCPVARLALGGYYATDSALQLHFQDVFQFLFGYRFR
jgi:hypothetical protein